VSIRGRAEALAEIPKNQIGHLETISASERASADQYLGCARSQGDKPFIETHLARLNAAFGLSWKRAPAYTAIRYILRRLDPASIEAAFRKHAGLLQSARDKLEAAGGGQGETGPSIIAIDGKTLKHSFDNFNDRKAAHILNAFAADSALILAHTEVDDKSNEIPAAQKLMAELNLTGRIVTLDAMHCQKNFRSRRQGGRSFDRPDQGQSAQPA
jgi:hypothetical protein